jgi:hypothetical protein
LHHDHHHPNTAPTSTITLQQDPTKTTKTFLKHRSSLYPAGATSPPSPENRTADAKNENKNRGRRTETKTAKIGEEEK